MVKLHPKPGVQITRRGFKTKQAAKEAERELNLQNIKSFDMTFSDCVIELMKIYENNPSHRTYNEYASVYKNHIKPFWPDKKLSKYERKEMESYQKTLQNNGRSNHTVNKAVGMVSKTFAYAQRMGYCVNPFVGMQKLKHVKPPKLFLTYDEFIRFIEQCLNERYYVFFTLAFWNGFRRGELLAIQWKDVDFETAMIRIHQHVIYPGDGTWKVIEGRKNNSGYYSEVDPDTLEILRKYKQKESRVDGFSEDFYLFGGVRPVAPEQPRRYLKKTLKRLESPKMLTFIASGIAVCHISGIIARN